MEGVYKLFINTFRIALVLMLSAARTYGDTIPRGSERPLDWWVGVGINPAYVPSTNDFLDGFNSGDKKINKSLGGEFRFFFRYNPETRPGMLYPGLYQGVSIGMTTFNASQVLGNPASLTAFQGAPIFHMGSKVWFGYEWRFGMAFGWKHEDYMDNINGVISTSVTAHMGLSAKFHFQVSDRVELSAGAEAAHFSNGHTSWPNGGVNSIGLVMGAAYSLNSPKPQRKAPAALIEEADRGRWFLDVMAFGAWRTRVVAVGEDATPVLCRGKFPVAGCQVAGMRRLNRFVALGPSLDFQWDQSAGLADYWVDGFDTDDVRFYQPPFSKQISLGISGRAELTMPIFSLNVGIGYDFVNPKGNKAFYQSLALKTFVTKNLYLNVGYRVGSFKDPQNLMLGLGVRL